MGTFQPNHARDLGYVLTTSAKAYVPEIFPNRTRELGMGICLTVHWYIGPL